MIDLEVINYVYRLSLIIENVLRSGLFFSFILCGRLLLSLDLYAMISHSWYRLMLTSFQFDNRFIQRIELLLFFFPVSSSFRLILLFLLGSSTAFTNIWTNRYFSIVYFLLCYWESIPSFFFFQSFAFWPPPPFFFFLLFSDRFHAFHRFIF